MADALIASLAALIVIALIKVYSNKPQDSEGRTILSPADRIIGAIVIALAVVGIVFVKIDMYGIGNPLILLSPTLIGAYAIYSHAKRSKKE